MSKVGKSAIKAAQQAVTFKLKDIVPQKYYPKNNELAMLGFLSTGTGEVYRVTKGNGYYRIGTITMEQPSMVSHHLFIPMFLEPVPVFTPKKGAKIFPNGKKRLDRIIRKLVKDIFSGLLVKPEHSRTVKAAIKRGVKQAKAGKVTKVSMTGEAIVIHEDSKALMKALSKKRTKL